MRPRVVALAFTCRPDAGSEYEVGWRWSQAAGQAGDVLTLTRRQCYDVLPAAPTVSEHFGEVKRIGDACYKAVDLPGSPRLFVGRRLMRTHYLIWQVLVLLWVRRHRQNFDFAHHICFVSAWFPPMVAAAGLPYIWGPVGASAGLPSWARKGLKASVWNLVTQTITRLNPLVKLAARRAMLVVPINKHVSDLIGAQAARQVAVRPSIALDLLASGQALASHKPLERATIVCSTRNVPIKLPSLCYVACEALARRHPQVTVKIFGDEVDRLFTSTLPNFKIGGALVQDQFFVELQQAQVLLFPTLEGSGFVALEALARGLPIVCLQGSGPADFVGGVAGMAVAVGHDELSTAAGLVDACERLLGDASAWQQCSSAAAQRAHLYTWAALDVFLKEAYGSVAKALA